MPLAAALPGGGASGGAPSGPAQENADVVRMRQAPQLPLVHTRATQSMCVCLVGGRKGVSCLA